MSGKSNVRPEHNCVLSPEALKKSNHVIGVDINNLNEGYFLHIGVLYTYRPKVQ